MAKTYGHLRDAHSFEMVEQMRAYPDDKPMTMDEIHAEVNALRQERWPRAGGR